MRSRAYKSSRAGRRRSPTPIPELDESFDHSERDYDTRTSIRSFPSGNCFNSYESFKGKASYPLLTYLYSFHLTKRRQNRLILVQIFILEDFKAKVISDYHHSRKVSVKQKSRNSRYRLDNRNRGDHDDRDDDDGHGRRAGAKDISKRIGNRSVSLFTSKY